MEKEKGWRVSNYIIESYFRWFDLWIGLYWDQEKRVLYVGYFPTLGFKLYKKG